MNSTIITDASEVINLFARLKGKEQKKVYKAALKKSGSILVRQTRKNLKRILGKKATTKNRWKGKTMSSGVKVTTGKSGEEAKIHIMGDFRLKFFEKGTDIRKTKNKGLNRGSIKGKYFFKAAKSESEQAVFNSLEKNITASINKVAKRNGK